MHKSAGMKTFGIIALLTSAIILTSNSRLHAEERLREVLASNLTFMTQAVLDGKRTGTDELGLQLSMAAYRLRPADTPALAPAPKSCAARA